MGSVGQGKEMSGCMMDGNIAEELRSDYHFGSLGGGRTQRRGRAGLSGSTRAWHELTSYCSMWLTSCNAKPAG